MARQAEWGDIVLRGNLLDGMRKLNPVIPSKVLTEREQLLGHPHGRGTVQWRSVAKS